MGTQINGALIDLRDVVKTGAGGLTGRSPMFSAG
jgi:hypothetical protein